MKTRLQKFKKYCDYITTYVNYKKARFAYVCLYYKTYFAYKKISVYVGISGFAPKVNAKYDECILVHQRKPRDVFNIKGDLFSQVMSERMCFSHNKYCPYADCKKYKLQHAYVDKRKLLKQGLKKYQQSRDVFVQVKMNLKEHKH